MIVVRGASDFQRAMGVEHAAAAGAKHVPGQIEQARAREACRKPEITRSSSSPVVLEKSKALIRFELMVLAVIDQMARSQSATAGSAVCLRGRNQVFRCRSCRTSKWHRRNLRTNTRPAPTRPD